MKFANPLLENLLREKQDQNNQSFVDVVKNSNFVVPYAIGETNGFPYTYNDIPLHFALEDGYLLIYSKSGRICEDIKIKFPLCITILFDDIIKQHSNEEIPHSEDYF